MEEMQEALDKVNKKFSEEHTGLFAEPTLKGNVATIRIDWGDWKHEHGYADYVMLQNEFVKVSEDVTEEDGSDCYSSIHTYVFNKVAAFFEKNRKILCYGQEQTLL